MDALVEVLRFLIDNGPGRSEAERQRLHDLVTQIARPAAQSEQPEGGSSNA